MALIMKQKTTVSYQPVHWAQLIKTCESSAVQPDFDPCFHEILTRRRDLSCHWRPGRSPLFAFRSSHSLNNILLSSLFPSCSAGDVSPNGNVFDDSARATTADRVLPWAVNVSGIRRPIFMTGPFCFGTALSFLKLRLDAFNFLRIRLSETWFESSDESESGSLRFLNLVDFRRSCVESATARTASLFSGVAGSLAARRVSTRELFDMMPPLQITHKLLVNNRNKRVHYKENVTVWL